MTAKKHGSNDSIFKIAANLAITCIISGIIIAAVFTLTDDIATAKQAELKTQALKSLVEEADQYIPIENKEGWYMATLNGKTIAYVVPTESKGYAGTISVLTAIGTDHKVICYSIIESKETPGLGDKASKEPFISQFPGKTSGELEVTKDASNKVNIQAISGATITSRAVTLAIKNAVEELDSFAKGGE